MRNKLAAGPGRDNELSIRSGAKRLIPQLMICVGISLILAGGTTAHAGVYKCIDPQGAVKYQQNPCSGADREDISPDRPDLSDSKRDSYQPPSQVERLSPQAREADPAPRPAPNGMSLPLPGNANSGDNCDSARAGLRRFQESMQAGISSEAARRQRARESEYQDRVRALCP